MAALVLLSGCAGAGDESAALGPPTTGSLSVSVDGLPSGVSGSLSVTSPQGFQKALTGSETLTALHPGSYRIAATDVVSTDDRYTPAPVSQDVTVAAGTNAAVASVAYGLTTGKLQIDLGGLPAGAGAAISVTGPQGFSRTVTSDTLFTGLVPGDYAIQASEIQNGGLVFLPSPVAQSAGVTATLAPEVRTVSYAAGVGSLSVTIGGLPFGSAGNVSVSGPAGFSHSLTGTQALDGVPAGMYTISAGNVTLGGTLYAPAPASQSVSVSPGAAGGAAVTYAATAGGLNVTISGLPAGVGAGVTVTGPAGFTRTLTATQTLSGLAPGSYSVTAVGVVNGGTTYAPAPANQTPVVIAGGTASAPVVYSPSVGGTTLDLTVNGVYLTQAIQKYDGSVPLVAGRDAYLRVFGLANQGNSTQPDVRVRLYNGATLVQTYTIAAPSAGVPTAVTEGALTSSWNVLVPAALVQPGLRVLADVDPGGAIAETDETNNRFPASGTPAGVDVRALPTFQIRFVPVLQQANGMLGNVSDANKESFLTELKVRLPVGAYAADVRAPYTTTAPAVDANNTNGAWSTILSEVLALRSTDGSSSYYYGVLRTSYSSGVAGIGYVGGSARTAIGWDVMPSGSSVMAHEVGHNMSRQHAPCGGAASPDPAFPYAGGQIGGWGLDLTSLLLKAPTTADVMGYCHPEWISDYNWSGMLSYRQGGPNNAPSAAGSFSGEGLLVWGRITDAGIVLEPGFRVAASPESAPRGGPFRLDLLAADGSLVRTASFDAAPVGDLPDAAERHFSFVLPLNQGVDLRVASFRVRAGALTATRLPTAGAGGDPESDVARANSAQVRVRWNAARYPMVMVRDAMSGQVLSFARGGSATLWSGASGFRLEFSDGVQTLVRQTKPLK